MSQLRITEFVKTDDGATVTKAFRIAGTTANGIPLPTVTVPADRLTGFWWLSDWGGMANVTPGYGMGHLWHALVALSDPIPQRTVYAHLGWRQIDRAWVYLHGGGAIGADGPVDGIECAPGGSLNDFVLPPVQDLPAAVRASLSLFDQGPVGTLAYALTYRAPLCEFQPVDFAAWLAGRTGSMKSAAAAMAQAHWGRTWDYLHHPTGWSTTANALEKIAYLAKDAVVVIDDYAPQKTESGRRMMEEKAERVLRAQGNQQGRGRMNPDATLKEAYPPRGIIVGTGEDVPSGASLRSRLVIEQMKAGDLNLAKIVTLDRTAAKTGLLAQAMAGYVRHLAGRTETLAAELAQRSAELIDPTVGSHARTSHNLASLLLGVEQGLAYAVASGAINRGVASELRKTAEGDLRKIATGQEEEIVAEDEVTRFLGSVRSALMSGVAHVITKSGDDLCPKGYETVTGWQQGGFDPATGDPFWRAQGKTIGWLDLAGDRLLLDPEQSLVVAQQQQRGQGGTISLTVPALGKRLKEAGKLADAEDGRNTKLFKVRGAVSRLWVLSASEVLGIDEVPPTAPTPTEAKAKVEEAVRVFRNANGSRDGLEEVFRAAIAIDRDAEETVQFS